MSARGLRSALTLLVREAGVLLHPPGSSAYLALMLAIAGFEVGLNTPYTISETLALRTLATDGLGAFVGALRALPDPSRNAVASAILLLIVVLFTLGGWIRTSLAVVRGEEPDNATWNQGLSQSGRVLVWLGLVALIVLAAVGAMGVLTLGALKAWFTGTLGASWRALAMPVATSLGFGLTLVGAAYAVGATTLMGIVAVAEPQTHFVRLPGRAMELFAAGQGERFVRRGLFLVGIWLLLKLSLLQLVVPFSPMAGVWVQAYSVLAAIINAALMAGDGLVALLAFMLGAQAYQDGVERLSRTS